MAKERTQGIEVSASATYSVDHSKPDESVYVWIYDIEITNHRDDIVQLLSRHWKITDAKGNTETVEDTSVVGLQPIIKPGETFSYKSFCPLNTAGGSMHGFFGLQDLERDSFEAIIPQFQLVFPENLIHAGDYWGQVH